MQPTDKPNPRLVLICNVIDLDWRIQTAVKIRLCVAENTRLRKTATHSGAVFNVIISDVIAHLLGDVIRLLLLLLLFRLNQERPRHLRNVRQLVRKSASRLQCLWRARDTVSKLNDWWSGTERRVCLSSRRRRRRSGYWRRGAVTCGCLSANNRVSQHG